MLLPSEPFGPVRDRAVGARRDPVPAPAIGVVPGGLPCVRSPQDAFALFRPLLARAWREHVAAAYLAAGGALLALSEVAEGDAVAAALPVAAILRDAVLRGAPAIIVAHNHPVGDATPSLEDIRATRRLADVASGIGLCLLDHIVVARSGWSSFRLMGLL